MQPIQALIDQAYHTLQQQNARVVLLHPDSRYRSLLLAKLVEDPQYHAFYYAMDSDDISVRAFIESLTRHIASQSPLFGRYLNLLPNSAYESFAAHEAPIMQAMAQELNALSDQPYLFLLDEYDRSDNAEDIHRFIELLANVIPPHCTLILNGRTLPRLPWISMIARQQASILFDDTVIQNQFYGSPRHDQYDMVASTLGPGYVIVNGALVDNWEGHLPRLLFFFALDRPVVTRAEICTAFWPELNVEQAVNVFHVTKRRLHKALQCDVLVHYNNHYRINPDLRINYDAMEFVEILLQGRRTDNPDRMEAWKRAVELYKGPFLQGHTEKWIIERRAAYRFGYLEALLNIGQHWLERDRPEMAIRYYETALAEDYQREDVHRKLMSLFTQLGRRSEAVAHYQNLERATHHRNALPDPETIALYQRIIA